MRAQNSIPSYGAMLLTAIALGVNSPSSFAQSASDYPNKPLRMIVPFPAGGSADTIARITSQKLTERWNQQVIVDNRPGAGGNIGADQLAKSPRDGYTLMMGTIALAISAGLYSKLPFDVNKDFTPISMVATVPMILVTHPSVPAKSVKDLWHLPRKILENLPTPQQGMEHPATLQGHYSSG